VGDASLHAAAIVAVAAASRGQLFASADEGGVVSIWGREVQRIYSGTPSRRGVGCLCWMGESSFAVALGCGDGAVRVLNGGTGAAVATFELTGAVTALSFARDKPALAAGTANGQVCLLASGSEIAP
jgi:WD40 repeat protein